MTQAIFLSYASQDADAAILLPILAKSPSITLE